MKYLLFLLLAASLVDAPDESDPRQQVIKSYRSMQQLYTEKLKKERQLIAHLKKAPAGSTEAQKIVQEQEETHQIVRALAKGIREFEPQVKVWENEIRFFDAALKAINGDRRRPTRENISGVWASPHFGPGYRFQLDQRGETVSGRGYFHSCVGSDGYEISGTYQGNLLTLHFREASGATENFILLFVGNRQSPRFSEKNGVHKQEFIPDRR